MDSCPPTANPSNLMTKDVLVAVDAGGSHVKATVFRSASQEYRTCSEPIPLARPGPGLNERDPELLWQATARCLRSAIAQLGASPGEVLAVGLTGHGNGVYLVDRFGRPTRSAIMATDSRAAGLVRAWVADGVEDALRPQAWNGLWPGMTGPALAWLARFEPHVLKASFAVLGCKDYVRARLTGMTRTEISQATACGLYDNGVLSIDPTISELVPNETALEVFEIGSHRRLLLPTISSLDLFEVSPAGAAATGLPAGTPVVAGLVDNPAAQHGSGVFDSGSICVGAGTWSINQLLVPASEMTASGTLGRVRPYAAALALTGQGLLCEASPTSASTLSWALEQAVTASAQQDRAAGRDPYASRLAAEAERRPRLDDPMFLPFIDGSRWEAGARGAWIGLSSATMEAELLGAVLEGICLEHRRHVERLEQTFDTRLPVRLSGGATRSPHWCQLFADILARPVSVSPVTELGSVCAAAMAATAVGAATSVEQAVAVLNPVWRDYAPREETAALVGRRWELYRHWASQLDRQVWGVE